MGISEGGREEYSGKVMPVARAITGNIEKGLRDYNYFTMTASYCITESQFDCLLID